MALKSPVQSLNVKIYTIADYFDLTLFSQMQTDKNNFLVGLFVDIHIKLNVPVKFSGY